MVIFRSESHRLFPLMMQLWDGRGGADQRRKPMSKGIEKPRSWKEWCSGRKWYAYPLLPEWIAEWAHYGFNQVELLKVASVAVFLGGMGQYVLDAPQRQMNFQRITINSKKLELKLLELVRMMLIHIESFVIR